MRFRYSLSRAAAAILCAGAAWAQSAYVRVDQAGYEASTPSFRAYLMSGASETGAFFRVLNAQGEPVYTASIGAQLGTWSHSATSSYAVYALDFTAPAGLNYRIEVTGPAPATSPVFAIDAPANLYTGLLLDSRFFYETERDGAN